MNRAAIRRALSRAVVSIEPLDSRVLFDGGPTAFTFSSGGSITPGKQAVMLQIQYTQLNAPVQLSSIGTGDLVINGPNSFTETPVFVSANQTTDAASIVATYQFAAPGGFFDSSDSGTYTVTLQPNQVFDTAGNSSALTSLSSVFVPTFPKTIVSSGPIIGISVGTDARLQVVNTQFNGGQFYSPGSFPGNAGITIRLPNSTSYGTRGSSFQAVSQTLSDDGLSITTVNNAGFDPASTGNPIFQDTQVVSYQPGNPFFRVLNTIQNKTSVPQTFDFFFAADLYLADSDSGVGFFNPTTNAVGGTDRTGQYNIFYQPDPETPAYTNYQEGPYGTVTSVPGTPGVDYNNTVGLPTSQPPYQFGTEPTFIDNGAGIEWKSVTLEPGASTTLGFYAAFGNVTVVSTGPTASLVSAPTITSASTKSTDITITFNDGTTVNAASLNGDEIQVTGPNGFVQNATLVSTGLVNGNSVTATYRLTPPGGFSRSGSGTYTVNYLSNSVQDIQGNGNPGAAIGTFAVTVPASAPTPVVVKVGGLDPTFGNGDGVAKVTLQNQKAVTAGIVTQSDGKLIVAATVTPAAGGNSDFEVFRLNADGTIDTSFGVAGFARANFPTSSTAKAVQLLPDGRILIVGSAANSIGGTDVALARFTSSGTLDTTFQGTGRTQLALRGTPATDVARAIAINSNGTFYIAGSSDAGAGKLADFAVAKFKVDGSLDSSFNKGAVFLDLGGADVANAITVAKNGQVILAGSTAVGGKTRFAVARINTNGKIDANFAKPVGKKPGTGATIIPIGTVDDEAFAVTVEPNGEIVVGGFSATGSLAGGSLKTKFALVGLLPNGNLDPTFGGPRAHGKVLTPFAGQDLTSITSLSISGKGDSLRILASGKAATTLANGLADSRSIALARYTANGQLDTLFGTKGTSVILQPDTLSQIAAAGDTPSLSDQFNSFTQDAQGAIARTAGGGIRALASDSNTTSTSVFVAAVVPDGVDLTGALKTVGPAKVMGGAAGSGTLTISNDGSLPAGGALGVTFYASTDQDLSDDDIAFSPQNLPGGSIPAGKSKTYKVNYVYPKTLPTGQYFIIAKVNSGKKPIQEINFENNEADGKPVTISQPFVDLTGSFKNTPAKITKGKGTLDLAITNLGNVDATGPLTVILYATPTNTFTGTEPIIPTTKLTTGIKAKSTKVLKLNYTLPTGAVPAGSDFLYAVLQYGGNPADTVPENNVFFSTKQVTFS